MYTMYFKNHLPEDHPYYTSKTELQWRKEGRAICQNAVGLKMYSNRNCNGSYIYYTEEQTRPATPEELKFWHDIECQKRKEARHLLKQKKAEQEEHLKRLEEKLQAEQEKRERLDTFESNITTKMKCLQPVKKSKIICLDVETTGLDYGYDEILQISILDGTGRILMNEYIQPRSRTEWPIAEEIHHISPEMLKDCESLQTFMPSIQKIIDSADLIVGYNVVFDLMFLTIAGLSLPDQVIISDVMQDFAPICGDWNDYFGDYTWKSLSTCASYFDYQISENDYHNSLTDAKVTLYCFFAIQNPELFLE